MRRRKLPIPRYVDPASVDEGDTIRVTWKVGDVEHTRTGKVGAIHDSLGTPVKVFVTPQGNEIARVTPENRSRVKVTLLEKSPAREPTLF